MFLLVSSKNFDIIIILRFVKTKATKKEKYSAKKPIKIWDVDIDNIVISK